MKKIRNLVLWLTSTAVATGGLITSITTAPHAHASTRVYSVPGAQFWVKKPDQWYSCSVGLPFWRDGIKGGGFVTAAHCFLTTGSHYVTAVYGANGKQVGYLTMIGGETIADNNLPTRVDWAIVHLYNSLGTTGYDIDYDHMPIMHPQHGENICKVGYRTGYLCGSTIGGMLGISNDQDTLFFNKHLKDTVFYSQPKICDHGDSGGLVYDPHHKVILGIISGMNPATNTSFMVSLDRVAQYIPGRHDTVS